MTVLKLSLMPVDVGFDLRQGRLTSILPDRRQLRVEFLDRNDKKTMAVGTAASVARQLRSAGYHVRIKGQPRSAKNTGPASAKNSGTGDRAGPGTAVPKIFARVDIPPGPEATFLARDSRRQTCLRVEWDEGGRDLKNPLINRRDGLYITFQDGTIYFLDRQKLTDLARIQKEGEDCGQ